jgi:hypothetical protein
MIDPVQLPVLLKAIDFVFDEGRKILAERRERRKLNDDPQDKEEEGTRMAEALPDSVNIIEVKQDLKESKIDETLWQNHEMEIQHLVKLLETYSRNYHLVSEQYAKWGSALVPAIIMHNMTEAENSMIETITKLENVLSKVYKKELPPIQ